MKFGFMPSSKEDIFSELNFAKEHFDFIELTYNQDFEYSDDKIRGIRDELGDYPALGHLHWEIDFSSDSGSGLHEALKQIGVFQKLGVSQITLHPSAGRGIEQDAVIKNNSNSFKNLHGFCTENGLLLSVENILGAPFNDVNGLEQILLPSFGFTLDVGHANLNSVSGYKNFLDTLGSRLCHIHLHNTDSGLDHIPFDNNIMAENILSDIVKTGYDKTITLEIFYSLEVLETSRALTSRSNGFVGAQRVPLAGNARRKVLLEQLKMLKELCPV